MTQGFKARLKAGVALAAILGQLSVIAGPASAFCGFYVAKADTQLFNKSSKVVIARDGEQTAITMASDYEGKPDEFALVVPVPTFIAKDQISVVDTKTLDHLDAYTEPRLVEYYDENPCEEIAHVSMLSFASAPQPTAAASPPPAAYPGVTVEARYDVAEYDISILSAGQSDGLIQWLNDNGYRIPPGAEPVIGSYIKQNMHFFVAKVNVRRMNENGRAYLRPLQVRYRTNKFMLPLRLGTVNASGPQDLVVYALTQRGRVEAANYRTIKVPSGIDVPLFVVNDFPNFYKAAFDRAVARANRRGVFVEYAWDMSFCDPCSAAPLSNPELAALGAQWVPGGGGSVVTNRWLPTSPPEAFVTRLHVRYDANTFPEDLIFIETPDRDNFQARYVLHHPYVGARCSAARTYADSLPVRFRQEAKNLADLTGWPETDIAAKMAANGQPFSSAR